LPIKPCTSPPLPRSPVIPAKAGTPSYLSGTTLGPIHLTPGPSPALALLTGEGSELRGELPGNAKASLNFPRSPVIPAKAGTPSYLSGTTPGTPSYLSVTTPKPIPLGGPD